MHVLPRPQVAAQGVRAVHQAGRGGGAPTRQQEGRWRGAGCGPGHDHQCPAPCLRVPFDNNGLCTNPLELGAELGGLVPWG